MDERQAQLVNAAEALRAWVHVQRAGWTSGAPGDFSNLRTPLAHGAAALASPAPVDVVADGTVEAAFNLTVRSPSRPPVDVVAIAFSGLRGLARLGSRGASVAGRFWQVGLASAILVALLWTGTAYWPVWSRIVKAQLAAAGEHASVFDRQAPPAAAAPAKSKGPERTTGKRTGRVQVDSNPAGALVIVDGRDRGVTPLTLSDLPVGTHTVILRGAGGSVQRTVSVSADKTTQLNEAIYSGWVHVSSPIELEITEGAHAIHLDDSNQVLLPPGPHELRFENRLFGFVDVQTVDIKPGDTTAITVQPPTSKLTILASTPAEVLVDGLLVGGTPLSDFALDVGTREIIVRNAAGAERRAMITVTVVPVKLEIDFNKP